MNSRLEVSASASDGDGHGRIFACTGQVARTLRALVAAGERGVTSLEISTWALRTSHYVYILRHRHGLDIVTLREPQDGLAGPGSHGRYVLKTPVRIIRVRRDREAA